MLGTILSQTLESLTNKRKAWTIFAGDVIFAGAPAKSISAKNHQDLYRSARHWRCIFAVYIGRRTLLTSRKLEFGIIWRGGRACDSCKRVIHMGALLLVSRKLKFGKLLQLRLRFMRPCNSHCNWWYLSLACNCRINENRGKKETREGVEVKIDRRFAHLNRKIPKHNEGLFISKL